MRARSLGLSQVAETTEVAANIMSLLGVRDIGTSHYYVVPPGSVGDAGEARGRARVRVGVQGQGWG